MPVFVSAGWVKFFVGETDEMEEELETVKYLKEVYRTCR